MNTDPSKLPPLTDIRYEEVLQVFQVSAFMGHCAFGKFEQQVGYLLFTPTKVSKRASFCGIIWTQLSSCCNSRYV